MKTESEIKAIIISLQKRLNEIDDEIYLSEKDPNVNVAPLKYESSKTEGQIHALRWVLQSSVTR